MRASPPRRWSRSSISLEAVRDQVAGDHRPGPAGAVRPHPLHPARQEGPRALAARGAAARPQLHRHRAHPARPDPRGRGRRRPGAGRSSAPTSTGSASRSSSCSPATRARRPPAAGVELGLQRGRRRAVVLAGARPVRPQPDPGRPRRQARPGHRPRAAQIERVMQVLSRRTKNNPVLIGEPGVGKTADRRGPRPGHRQAATCRRRIKDKQLYTLDLGCPGRRLPLPR